MGRGNESLHTYSRSHDPDGRKTFKSLLHQKRKFLKLAMGLQLYKAYINDDLGLTLTHFTARSYICSLLHFYGHHLKTNH